MPDSNPNSNETRSNKLNIMPLITIAVLSLVIGMGVSQFLFKKTTVVPKNLEATLLDKSKPLTAFNLIDHNNNAFNLDSLKGNWSFLFFGYTHCPDVCPLAMQVMRKVWQDKRLETTAKTNLKMIFVSVDPDRDTPAILKSYAQYYNPAFIGVTGKADGIDNLTRQLGILYGFEEPNKNGDYNVAHSGQIILIDPKGNMRAVFSPPLNPKSITKDFIAIQKFVEDN